MQTDFSPSLIKHIHITGICGTAMGNMAVGLKQQGFNVTGSDKGVYPPMSDVLKENGIEIHSFDSQNVKNADLVIIGNAIGRGNVEAEYVLNHRVSFISMPEALKRFFVKDRILIMITGTHGKTTTTALISHILEENGLSPSYMVGGVQAGKPSGFKYGENSRYFVMEGDEYDTAFFDKTSKFLKFSPDYLIVNGIEFDHADIFDSIEDIRKSFRFLLRRTPGQTKIIGNIDDKEVRDLKNYCYSLFFSFGEQVESNSRIKKIIMDDGKTVVTLTHDNKDYTMSSCLPGRHNAHNIAAAFLLAQQLGIAPENTIKAVESFKGVKRRFQTVGTWEKRNIRFIEDFAHHPTAVASTLEACRELFKGRRIVAVFEPATNTIRSGHFRDELEQALMLADLTLLLPVPSKKTKGADDSFKPDEFNREGKIMAVEDISLFEKTLLSNLQNDDVVIMMSNSSFQGIMKTIEKLIGSGN